METDATMELVASRCKIIVNSGTGIAKQCAMQIMCMLQTTETKQVPAVVASDWLVGASTMVASLRLLMRVVVSLAKFANQRAGTWTGQRCISKCSKTRQSRGRPLFLKEKFEWQ